MLERSIDGRRWRRLAPGIGRSCAVQWVGLKGLVLCLTSSAHDGRFVKAGFVGIFYEQSLN